MSPTGETWHCATSRIWVIRKTYCRIRIIKPVSMVKLGAGTAEPDEQGMRPMAQKAPPYIQVKRRYPVSPAAHRLLDSVLMIPADPNMPETITLRAVEKP